MKFDILYQDKSMVVIDKPSGFHVHKPDLAGVKVPPESVILNQLRAQINEMVYPIHRLDTATSGCLLWGLSSNDASLLSEEMQSGKIQKLYRAVVRGWCEDSFVMDRDLGSIKHKGQMQSAVTLAKTLKRIELNVAVGARHSTARYSLLELELKTGRYHQVRRHLNHASHPVLGDVSHGDRSHNRYFREELRIEGLCLRAVSLKLAHPLTRLPISVEAPVNEKWAKIYSLFGC